MNDTLNPNPFWYVEYTPYKKFSVCCPSSSRTQTVYFNLCPSPDGLGYCFNGCDDLSGSQACKDCRRRTERLFRLEYPELPLLVPVD